MRTQTHGATGCLALLVLHGLVTCLATGSARAERPPWTTYTTSHGLAGDAVTGLFQDSLGFLWIATSSGLSRFDGTAFRNYGVAQGLPGPRVSAVAETADGSLWLASTAGLARRRPDAAPTGSEGSNEGTVFETIPLPPAFDADGVRALCTPGSGDLLYAGNARGLLRVRLAPGDEIALEEIDLAEDHYVIDLEPGPRGDLWIATTTALVHLDADGGLQRHVLDAAYPVVAAVTADRDGRLWLIAERGLLVWWPGADSAGASGRPSLRDLARWPAHAGDLPRAPGEAVYYDLEHGMPSLHSTEVAVGRAATWVATRNGVLRFADDGMTLLGVGEGLNEPLQWTVLEDAGGSLWLGSSSRGLSRLGRSGFVAFDQADGLADDSVTSVFESGGETYVVTSSLEFHRLDGKRFLRVTPDALAPPVAAGWGWNQTVLRDRLGAFWMPTASGLFRFPPVPADRLSGARPDRRWSIADGLPGDDVFRLYEDRQGTVWVSMISTPPLVAIDGDRIVPVPEITGTDTGGAPTAFAEDRSGALWLGFYLGGLARRSRSAETDSWSWRFVDADDGVPPGFVGDLHLDRRGQLWLATSNGGVAVIEDPQAEPLTIRRYTTRDGLATDSTRCFAEDADGRLFVGTTRGVDVLDPEVGVVASYSIADGLPNSVVWSCHAASDGGLWFGTLHGLARFVPPPDEPRRPPGILLTGVRVDGRQVAVADRGVESLGELVLAPGQRSLQIAYVGVAPDLGRGLRYQHRVLGAADEWSQPSAERSVQLAALAPGSYRFEVRSATLDGLTSTGVAALEVRVLPHLWQRRWFPPLLATLAAALAALVFRLRTSRLVAVERARTRIAADLHDDVGSSVSRIALLGELARRRLGADPDGAEELLGEIAREAGELAEATSDIVWAIDPRRDDLGSLVVRLRRFAADLLEAKDIALDFPPPAGADRIRLSPSARRTLYLTLKEAIHNVAKHSGARRASVEIRVLEREIHAEVADDGRGIAAGRAEQAAAEGRHGLPGLVRRAREAGGDACVGPAEGGGTRVTLRLRRNAKPRR